MDNKQEQMVLNELKSIKDEYPNQLGRNVYVSKVFTSLPRASKKGIFGYVWVIICGDRYYYFRPCKEKPHIFYCMVDLVENIETKEYETVVGMTFYSDKHIYKLMNVLNDQIYKCIEPKNQKTSMQEEANYFAALFAQVIVGHTIDPILDYLAKKEPNDVFNFLFQKSKNETKPMIQHQQQSWCWVM